jgi:undecaprenyl pyrophosphate phosphatase UppP
MRRPPRRAQQPSGCGATLLALLIIIGVIYAIVHALYEFVIHHWLYIVIPLATAFTIAAIVMIREQYVPRDKLVNSPASDDVRSDTPQQ